jgi:hypothetical protein
MSSFRGSSGGNIGDIMCFPRIGNATMPSRHRLENPIALAEGGCISTVGDALDFYFSLPMRERIEQRWTEAAKLLVSTFEEDGAAFLKRAEQQLRLALAYQASDDCTPPARGSVPEAISPKRARA